MKALVLCGGQGVRLRPLTHTLAKQLVPVANKPIVHYVMQRLMDAGIRHVGVIVSPESKYQIREALEVNPWGHRLEYIVQEQPLGLAHAVMVARDFLRDDPFVMYLGDNMVGQDIKEFVDDFEASPTDAMVLLQAVADPHLFGVAEVDGEGKLLRLTEKPKSPTSNLALVGVYIFSSAIHDVVRQIKPSDRGELEITDAIQALLDQGNVVRSSILKSWWLDCGKKDDLLESNRVVLDDLIERSILGSIDEKTRVYGRVELESGANVKGSVIRGPAIIGEGTVIEDSFIGPFTSIGRGCQIRESSIEHSVVLDMARIIGVSRLEDSLIGRHAVVKQGEGGLERANMIIGDDSEVLL